MMAAILNSAILVSAILVFPLKVTHTCQDRFPLFAQKKTFTHSFWLNLMMAAILNSAMLDSDTAILDSDTLLSSLRLTQKHSPSTLTLTQIILTIWLTRWWQPSWIQPCCTKLWLNLIQSDSNWFILNELDDGSHLELCHLGFSHFAQKNFNHSFWLNLMMAAILNSAIMDSHILHKKNFTHSFWLNLMMAAILNSAILDSAILHKKNFTHSFWLNLMMAAILNSAIMDSPILHKKNFTHSFWLNLMMAAILNSAILDSDTAILDSDTLLSSLRFTQKHSHSILALTQTNSIWLKLIHSHLTWWWQSSWIWPSWIQPC